MVYTLCQYLVTTVAKASWIQYVTQQHVQFKPIYVWIYIYISRYTRTTIVDLLLYNWKWPTPQEAAETTQ